jgi:hypothetical protein
MRVASQAAGSRPSPHPRGGERAHGRRGGGVAPIHGAGVDHAPHELEQRRQLPYARHFGRFQAAEGLVVAAVVTE